MIVDCHVNLSEDRHLTPLLAEQMARIRPGGTGLRADADTLYAAMRGIDRAIVLALRCGGRREQRCDRCRGRAPPSAQARGLRLRRSAPGGLQGSAAHLGLKGVKYGPIYNGVPLSDPRMTPSDEAGVAHELAFILRVGTTLARAAPRLPAVRSGRSPRRARAGAWRA